MRPAWASKVLLLFLLFLAASPIAQAEVVSLTSVNSLARKLLEESLGISQSSSRLSKICSDASCTKCDSCDYGKLKSELFQCKRAVDTLKLKLSLDLSSLDIARECSFEKCYPEQREKYCRVIEHVSERDFAKELEQALHRRRTELRELKESIRKLKEPHEKSGLLEYGRKMDKARRMMAKQRAIVLKARSYNAELKKYLESFQHRTVMQEVARFRSENEDLYEHLYFWEAQNRTLSDAVRLSPRAVQEARDDLHTRMLGYEADARLLEVMRKSSFTKEDQVRLVGDLKMELRLQLDQVRTVNAHAKTEASFIEKAGQEIFNLLANIMNKMKQGEVAVGCGETALSKSVHNALTS